MEKLRFAISDLLLSKNTSHPVESIIDLIVEYKCKQMHLHKIKKGPSADGPCKPPGVRFNMS
jgi:hypothetical protein